MNEALRKELIERFMAEEDRLDSEELVEANEEYEARLKKVRAAHREANLNFDGELNELRNAVWDFAWEYAADSFVFGYEHCLTMLGLNH